MATIRAGIVESCTRVLRQERGSALMIVALFGAMTAFLLAAQQFSSMSFRRTRQQLNTTAQADNVARAGLRDAVNWFRRQKHQPVAANLANINGIVYTYPDAAFDPVQLDSAPAASDTIAAGIGLVKAYPLSTAGNLWGRYEIRRQQDPAVTDPHAVHDISGLRVPGAAAGDGLVWWMESVGYVYRLRNPAVAYNQAPNEVLAVSRVATEVWTLTLARPVSAAVIVSTADAVTAANTAFDGLPTDLAYYSGDPANATMDAATRARCKNTMQIGDTNANSALDPASVFRVSTKILRQIAENVMTPTSRPSAFPSAGLTWFEGDAVFDSGHPLQGGGVLLVNGNLTIESTAANIFSGCIFVTGNATLKGPVTVSGTVMVEGSLTTDGTAGQVVFRYDENVLTSVGQQLAQYRDNKATRVVFTAMEGKGS